MSKKPNVVLVHGAWADGSSWSGVIQALQANGFTVSAPQFPETSLAADVARLRQVLRRQDGPTIVAGHSYGGQIMTAMGADTPNVAGLVYVAAFGLDEGESLGSRRPPDARKRLTAQELQIAQLAARGLSNREIAERLFVSHRTIGSHLYHIFPKLGITARSQLRDALRTPDLD